MRSVRTPWTASLLLICMWGAPISHYRTSDVITAHSGCAMSCTTMTAGEIGSGFYWRGGGAVLLLFKAVYERVHGRFKSGLV